jgi:hypothetical protein
MSEQNHKNSIKKLAALMGVTSASIFLSVPALALINSNYSSVDGSLKNRTLNAESTEGSRQLLAQGSSGTGGTGTGGTGAGGTGTGGTGTVQPGTGGTGTGGTGTVQPSTGGTGTGGTGAGGTGAEGTGTGGTGTVQPGTGGTGAGGTGTGGTGTVQPGTGGTGTGGTGTGGTGTGQTANFEQLMRAGYAATQQRDYSTALAYFQQALQLRPNNPYATRAVSNVQSYMQRDAQRGTTTTPTNQIGR